MSFLGFRLTLFLFVSIEEENQMKRIRASIQERAVWTSSIRLSTLRCQMKGTVASKAHFFTFWLCFGPGQSLVSSLKTKHENKDRGKLFAVKKLSSTFLVKTPKFRIRA